VVTSPGTAERGRERRLAEEGLARVHVGAPRDQQADDVEPSFACREQERRLSVPRRLGVHGHAGVEEPRDGRGVADTRGVAQRLAAVGCGSVRQQCRQHQRFDHAHPRDARDCRPPVAYRPVGCRSISVPPAATGTRRLR
jgi:hypothetical protein